VWTICPTLDEASDESGIFDWANRPLLGSGELAEQLARLGDMGGMRLLGSCVPANRIASPIFSICLFAGRIRHP
jgi:hypothetical protein